MPHNDDASRPGLEVIRGGLLDSSGNPIKFKHPKEEKQEEVKVLNPSEIAPALCTVKGPNGEYGIFSNFAVYGIGYEGVMCMAYCDLADIHMAIKAMQKIFDSGMEQIPEEGKTAIFARIAKLEEELHEISGASNKGKTK